VAGLDFHRNGIIYSRDGANIHPGSSIRFQEGMDVYKEHGTAMLLSGRGALSIKLEKLITLNNQKIPRFSLRTLIQNNLIKNLGFDKPICISISISNKPVAYLF